MRIRYRTRALSDLDGIYDYLAPRSQAGALNVLRSIHDAIEQIAAHPLAAIETSMPGIRVKILGRYRYKVFYSIADADSIEIIHVRHSARQSWSGD